MDGLLVVMMLAGQGSALEGGRAANLAASTGDLAGLVNEALSGTRPDARTPKQLAGLIASTLERRGPAASLPSHERLIVLDANNLVVRVIDGTESSLDLDADLERQLNQPESRIVLIHNHPNSASLSRNDIAQLAKPGVEAVIAIGHDGSVYVAGGARWRTELRRSRLIPAVGDELTRQLRMERPSASLDAKALDPHMSHLLALGLHKAQVIDYQYVLAPAHGASFDQWRPFFGRITEASAGKVRRELKDLAAR